MKNQLIMTIVVAILALGGGFFTGMKYQQSKTPQRGAFTRNGQNPNGFQRGGNGGGRVVGQILSSDSGSITVKLQDGSSKIVILSGTTTIDKAATGSVTDLTVGQNVAVFGQTNSDGSVTAQNIQLNPQLREFGGGNGNRSPNPSANTQ